MKGEYSKELCIKLLICKQKSLNDAGISRYPQRSDFENEEVCAIKAFLGPWPRALEAAELKPPRSDDYLQKVKEKRIKSKRRKTEALKNLKAFEKKASDNEKSADY